MAQLVKNPPVMQESWVGKSLLRRERLPTPVFWSGEFHGLHSPGDHKEYIMRNARLDEAQAGIEIARRNINNLDMQMIPP